MIRILLAVVVVGVAGCSPPVPVTVVQVPGLTPLPLARRTLGTSYERNEVVRQCVQSSKAAILTAQAKGLYCACMLDTLIVYVTNEEARDHNQKYGDSAENYPAALAAGTKVSRVIAACREQVLGE